MNRKKERKLKRFLISFIIILLVFIVSIWIWDMYSKISISQGEDITQGSVTGIKTSQTVEEVKQESKTIEEMIEKATSSIVGISKIKENGSTIFLKDGVSQLGLGTGFIVSEDGYIVTNEHVSGAKYSTCYVTLDTGKVYNANVVWSDSNLDLSIIKINIKGLPYIALGDSEQAKTGQNVYAIGNPIGFEFQRTVTSGIISAMNRTIKFEENGSEVYMADLIQTDATINPGNSGGPLIDPDGKVIGITTVKITSAEGIGFAVPINVIKPIIQKFQKEGNFEEATIGVFAYDKNVIPYLDGEAKLDAGIYVAQVIKSSPAEKAGIQVGDILTKIDGIEINKMQSLKEFIYTKNPGDEVTITFQRKKQTGEVKVQLGKK